MPDIVQMPDGTKIDMTGASPEAQAALQARIKAQVNANPSLWDQARGLATDAVRGVGKAWGSLADLAINNPDPELAQTSMAAKTLVPQSASGLNTAAAIKALPKPSAVGAVDDFLPTPPSGPVRQAVRSAIEGTTGALATGPLSTTTAAAGAGAGLGGWTADQIAPDNFLAHLLGSVGGAIATGTPAALLKRARPQTALLAKEGLEGLTDAELQAAQTYKNNMAQQGISIDLAQAVNATKSGGNQNLSTLRNFVASRSEGNQVQQTLNDQPAQLGTQAQMTVAGLPGNNYNQSVAANNLQETATGAVNQVKKNRTALVKDMYDQVGPLPEGSREELASIASQAANAPGASEVVKSKASDFLKKLNGETDDLTGAVNSAKADLAAATTPIERVKARGVLQALQQQVMQASEAPLHGADVNTWISELAGPWKGTPLSVASPAQVGQVKSLAAQLNQRFQQLSPEVAAAEAEYKRLTNEMVNPVKQGPAGILAQPGGYKGDVQAKMTAFDNLMSRGVDPTAKVSDVATAAKQLAAVDPSAFRDSFKGWLSRKVQGALEVPPEGQVQNNADMAGRLYDSIFKDPLQWQGIKDAVAEIARQNGQDPGALVQGLQNLGTLARAMTSRGPTGGLTTGDITRMGGSGPVATLTRLAGFMPFADTANKIENATLSKTLSQLDTILTSPEGASMLIKLGRTPVMSEKAKVIMGTLAGMTTNPPVLSGDNATVK